VWCVWLSKEAIISEQFRASGERFTKEDGHKIALTVGTLQTRQTVIIENQRTMLKKIDFLHNRYSKIDDHKKIDDHRATTLLFPLETPTKDLSLQPKS